MLIYPIFIPFHGCPFRCVYCQQETITHTDYKSNSIDIEKIKLFINKHKDIEKEIAFFGGTFTALKKDKQLEYFTQITPLIDDKTFFRVSTRPDCIDREILAFLQENKVKTIELGIQSFDNHVLEKSQRQYSAEQAFDTCKMVQEHGFDLSIQLMPGLPGDTPDIFIETVNKALSLKPRFMRIYPTIVLKGTALEKWYQQGKYQAWCLNTALHSVIMAAKIINTTNTKIIKIGLHSDLNINKDDIVAGPWHQNFGEITRVLCFYLKNYQTTLKLCISLIKKHLWFWVIRNLCSNFVKNN